MPSLARLDKSTGTGSLAVEDIYQHPLINAEAVKDGMNSIHVLTPLTIKACQQRPDFDDRTVRTPIQSH
jgi:hypothetical protein